MQVMANQGGNVMVHLDDDILASLPFVCWRRCRQYLMKHGAGPRWNRTGRPGRLRAIRREKGKFWVPGHYKTAPELRFPLERNFRSDFIAVCPL